MMGVRPNMPPQNMYAGQGFPGSFGGPGGGMPMGMMGGMNGPGYGGPGGPGAPVRLTPGPGQPGGVPPGGTGVPGFAGAPGHVPVVAQRKSSAIRIVNPDSKEEIKGDFKKPEPTPDTEGKGGADGKEKAAPLNPAAAATGARPAPGGYPGMAQTAQPGFGGPYGRPMMGAPGTSPGGPGDGFPTGFVAGSPPGDPAFAAAQAAQAHAHAHAHAQAMAAAMAAAGMTPPGSAPALSLIHI